MRLFATVSCLLAAIFGAAAIFLHTGPLDSIVFYVAWVWLLANIILSRAYKLEHWKGLDKTFSEIWRDAKNGTLPKTSALEHVTNLGALILMIVSMCLNFI